MSILFTAITCSIRHSRSCSDTLLLIVVSFLIALLLNILFHVAHDYFHVESSRGTKHQILAEYRERQKAYHDLRKSLVE